MNEGLNQSQPAGPEKQKKSPALALGLAFLPSVMLLGLFSVVRQGNPPAALLIVACLVSVVCCFTSAYLLFKRNTRLAIFVGIVFLILNGIVSFLFGCGAILSGMTFH